MLRKLFCSLPWLLLLACSASPDKYRDTKSLELPPTLAIEHTPSSTGYGSNANLPDMPGNLPEKHRKPIEDDYVPENKPPVKSESKPKSEENSAKAELSKLILITGETKKPTLTLKTRFNRAWILVANGLSSADIEIVDRDMEAGFFKVRYVAAGEGKGRGLLNSVTSFFTDSFADTEYKLTLDKDKTATEVRVDKTVGAENNQEAFNNDDSAALIKLLHDTIIDDLAK